MSDTVKHEAEEVQQLRIIVNVQDMRHGETKALRWSRLVEFDCQVAERTKNGAARGVLLLHRGLSILGGVVDEVVRRGSRCIT